MGREWGENGEKMEEVAGNTTKRQHAEEGNQNKSGGIHRHARRVARHPARNLHQNGQIFNNHRIISIHVSMNQFKIINEEFGIGP